MPDTNQTLETEQKALDINLDSTIYGTFSEIGAGQEVARYFFQVGAGSGTIAKTMSAYDKVYSDKIYGPEPSGRYVCESRLYKMLDHEYDLMTTRLQNERPGTNFFVFADTVSAINFSRTILGNGWLGLRFQLHPDGEPNDLIVHARMHDADNRLQQQAIGILGVNMVHACYMRRGSLEELINSLLDGLRGRVSIDMIRLSGPDFRDVDNRLLSLYLVKYGLTEVSMFGADRRPIHASEFLYRKSCLLVRGSFRPVTLVNFDMIQSSFEQFRETKKVEPRKSYLLTEITLSNLKGENDTVDDQDFLDRAELLNAMGQTVIISNCDSYQELTHYLAEYKVPLIGLVIGARELLDLMTQRYYDNLDGKLLSAFGELFARTVQFFVYPAQQEGSAELMTAQNLPVPEGVRFLYQHLLEGNQIVDVEGFNPDVLHIYSKRVLEMISSSEEGWEQMVPAKVANLIKEKCLFGFPAQSMEFEY